MHRCACKRTTKRNTFLKQPPPFLIVDVGEVNMNEHEEFTAPLVKNLPFVLVLGEEQ